MIPTAASLDDTALLAGSASWRLGSFYCCKHKIPVFSRVPVTKQQWQLELKAALEGTEWQYPSCLADVYHRTDKVARQIDLSRDDFRTAETRKAEVRRQLAGD
jgi:hypothetical protein